MDTWLLIKRHCNKFYNGEWNLFDVCFEKFGRLDILANNAGMMFTKPVVEVGDEEFDRIFAVIVNGTFLCRQQAAKRMSEAAGSSTSPHLQLL